MGMKMKNDLVDLGPDGNVRFMPTEPKYKELVQYVKNMWDAGILDKEMLTQGAPEVTAKVDKNLIGAYLNNNNAQVLGTVNMSKYVAIPTLTGPYGD
jgi:putative aldouronate transport system substrate-binding protein